MMMFIRGMTVDYGDQKLLFRDGRIRLELGDEIRTERERFQDVRWKRRVMAVLGRVDKIWKGFN